MATETQPPVDQNQSVFIERQHRHFEALLEISQAIGTMLDIDMMMEKIISTTTQVFNANRTTMYVHDPEKAELWAPIAQGLGDRKDIIRIPDNRGLAGHVFQTRRSLCVVDTHNDPHFARKKASETGYDPRSMIMAPIRHAGSACLGVLQVMEERVGMFDDHDLRLLEAIAVQVAISLENARLHEAQVRQFNSFVEALSSAIDKRDVITAKHSVNVANYAVKIGEIMGMDDAGQKWLRVAGLLHDIGKIGVREAVLTKPGRLEDDEFEQMKRHTNYGYDILGRIEFTEAFRGIDAIAPMHHEKLDGTGYPHGLSEDKIPLEARILMVADVFDALTQNRHYRKGMPMCKALAILDDMVPNHLDNRCVDALKQFLGPYASGPLAELSFED